ncbi:thymidine kinase [Spiroplasma sabaudiense Ar-1343]|uniref:Thymidine kinase n=1 Tax=Spiroplasma sabaudiense Ar-1343 TaxID=1276257 RepID=W6AB55_9MOLU|nr:thymidine kinase [Spiroplasma sabaudiense]AHI54216.1 thymidine kinase [Spiroplasma sabaudiense Ar-1343]
MLNKYILGKTGWIELITGCMFAGKTEEFIRRLRRHSYAKRRVVAFKPSIDDRYSESKIFSHNGSQLQSYPVKSSADILAKIIEIEKDGEFIDVIGIDELQFLDLDIVDLTQKLADEGKIVIVNGLDKDFKCEPFQNVDRLLVQAEYVDKLSAICHNCGANASRTQRIVNGKPASASEPVILVSGKERYEARCRHCYIKPK